MADVCHCEFTPAGSGRPALDETAALPPSSWPTEAGHPRLWRTSKKERAEEDVDGGPSPTMTMGTKPRFSVSSLPAFGRPPWMKLSALPDLGYSVGAVGTKVGPSLVRQSPRVSWTRRPGRPP